MKSVRSIGERLSAHGHLTGLLHTQPNPALAEMCGLCGYDFLILDCEHGLFSEMDHLHTLQAMRSSGIAALIRLRTHDAVALGRYLDMGADGIVVPNVTTAEQARALVRAMHYPPKGTRGFGAGLHRGTRYGMDVAAHLETPRGEASLIVIIESALGVANAAEILGVEGVDGALIGPSDLSADLGGVGNYSNPAYAQAIESVERAAAATGKFLGTGPHPGRPLETLLERGYRLLILGADMLLIREALILQLSKARASISPVTPVGTQP